MKNPTLRKAQLEYIKTLRLKGDVIDLGAKSAENKYYALLDKSAARGFTFVDYYHAGENVIKVDLEGKFKPIAANSYDEIIAFNTLEHIFDYQNFLNESYRIARKGGRLHLLTPFLYRYHADPHDYNRLTHEALQKALEIAGWHVELLEVTVGGRMAVICSVIEGNLPDMLANAFQYIMRGCDRLISKFRPHNAITFPLGYTVIAVKKK